MRSHPCVYLHRRHLLDELPTTDNSNLWSCTTMSSDDTAIQSVTINRQCDVMQALQTDWIATIGGKPLRPLNPDVARGAANVAAARRLRNMVHGAVALDTGSPDGSQRGPQDHMQEYRKRHTAQGQRAQDSRGYRSDPSCHAL